MKYEVRLNNKTQQYELVVNDVIIVTRWSVAGIRSWILEQGR